ncbi:unnamed protein product [Owenia fusiformis]|uniref:Uncharacterized protein n=1 Tax=Owenia fusiformis TaxID=6347 RepID=A0A8S4QBI6_OWEFU|nr:unnamed protein product [Owenia fusiformis]
MRLLKRKYAFLFGPLLGCICIYVYVFMEQSGKDKIINKYLRFDMDVKAVPSPFSLYGKADQNIVLYNRMPKCGSSTMHTFLGRLSQLQGKFRMKHSTIYGKRQLSDKKDIIDFARSLHNPNNSNCKSHKCVFDRHIHFVNFEDFGFKQPIYFNIIREPFEQRLSVYYYTYAKRKPEELTKLFRSHKNRTFEECIQQNIKDTKAVDRQCFVDPVKQYVIWFCGHEPNCSTNMAYGLQKAKHNIDKYHMLVGLTEEFGLTLKAMERILPSFFLGIGKFKASTKLNSVNDSKKKRPSSKMVIEYVKMRLKENYEIYNYVKQKFHATLKKLNVS